MTADTIPTYAANTNDPTWNGYSRAFASNYGGASFCYLAPFFVPVCIINGKPAPSATTMTANNVKDRTVATLTNSDYQRITRRRLYIPLLSGVLGVLLPKDNYKLIPGKALG